MQTCLNPQIARPLLVLLLLASTALADPSTASLHDAARRGNVEALKACKSQGADLDAVDGSGMTALHIAAWRGHDQAVAWLLDSGADPGRTDLLGQRPVDLAIAERHTAVVSLLRKSAKVTPTPKDVGSAGSVELLTELLGAGGDVNKPDADGRSPLHYAALRGSPEVITRLIQLGGKVDAVDSLGQTPLHLAALLDRTDAVAALIEGGAKPTGADKRGRTPLHVAAAGGGVDVVQQLIAAGGDPEAAGPDGTPLEIAEGNFNIAAIDAIVNFGQEEPMPPIEPIATSPPISPTTPTPPTTPTQPLVGPTVPQIPRTDTLCAALGFETMEPTAESLRHAGIAGGASIIRVTEGSIAARAGLAPGWIIYRAEDRELLSPEQLEATLRAATGRPFVTIRLLDAVCSKEAKLPLPLSGQRYVHPQGAWNIAVPDGWFLIPGHRNTAPDEGFDSFVSPDGKEVMIVARAAMPASEPGALARYEAEKMAEVRELPDKRLTRFPIGAVPAFQLSYHVAQSNFVVTRMSFVYGGGRYVINFVGYQTNDLNLPKVVADSIAGIRFQHVGTAPPAPTPPPAVPPQRGYVGVNICEVHDADARRLGVTARSGAVITAVYQNSPAAAAGLRAGDVVIGCDRRVIENCAQLTAILGVSPPLAQHVLEIRRGQALLSTKLTLGRWPAEYQQ